MLRFALLVAICMLHQNAAQARLITSTYRYNADGALTAVTTQMDQQAPATTYLTWDNFTPNAAAPTSGTVQAADGNLLGYGPSPGAAALSQRFEYDKRSRLSGCTVNGAPPVTYAYDASSALASSVLAGGDAQRFYYGATPQVTNQRQASTGMAASFLGPVRYLSDGSEQCTLGPRKDAAAVYDASQELLSPYAYEAYGASRTPPAPNEGLSPDSTRYDLGYNPFQFTGEYKDPVCGAYYLRARWYLPEQQIFLSRDPADPVHRYSYTGGDPINRSDPSGMSYRGYQRGIGKLMKKLTPWGVNALSVLPWIGPTMFLLQSSAAGEFWHNPSAAATLGFQVVSAGVMGALELPAVDRAVGHLSAFAARHAAEGVTAVGQSALSATGPHGRFEQSAFWESIGTTAGSIFLGRAVAGVGYRPFDMSVHDVDAHVAAHFAGRKSNDPTVLVYRVKARLRGGQIPMPFTSPVGELFGLGVYHEAVVGVGEHSMHYADMAATQINRDVTVIRKYENNTFGRDVPSVYWKEIPTHAPRGPQTFRFAGTFMQDQVEKAFADAPGSRGYLSLAEQTAHATANGGRPVSTPYGLLTNNCHDFAGSILSALGH